jgi:hypothetical protein
VSVRLFGPERDARIRAAASAIAPYGFVLGHAGDGPFGEQLPFVLHATPDSVSAVASGRIDAAEVWAFEYAYTSTDAEGNTSSHDQLVVIARHPRIEGGAAFHAEPREWSAIARTLDVLFWIPPFTLLKAFQWLHEARNPDRSVGDAEFDRLYRVRAASDEQAQRAIPRTLRETVLRLGVKAAIELRPGVIVYSIEGCGFDGEGLPRALGYAAPLLAATITEASHVYR